MKPTSSKKFDVYGVGNTIVDMEFEVTEEFIAQSGIAKGLRTGLSDVRQTELLLSLADAGFEHKRTAGCSAANKMIAVSQLGGKSCYCSRFANDEPGKFFYKNLTEQGVETGLSIDNLGAGMTGKCIVLVTPDGDRTMNTNLGTSGDISIKDLVQDHLKNSNYFYIEGYNVINPMSRDTMLEGKKIAEANGVKISLSFSDVNVVRAFKREFKEVIGDGVDLILCNEGEAYAYTGGANLEEVSAELKKITKTFAVTLGPKGALVYDGKEEVLVKTTELKAVDTTGAGDIFAGAMFYGINHGMSFEEAAKLGCKVASVLVMQFGARLSQDQMNRIKNDFQS